ncbi:unnamed protein product [marine sediment metagenome]|uniref:Uncharacterized protein n=1 Tax=marine sediment metagenome TaxID=412755 RepID=X1BZS8_9ZZZZ
MELYDEYWHDSIYYSEKASFQLNRIIQLRNYINAEIEEFMSP